MRTFKCRFLQYLVTFFASCSKTLSINSKRCALASPRLRRSSPGSWLLFLLYSILWGFRMRRYLDDWLVQSTSRESLLGDLQTVPQLCQELGDCGQPSEFRPGSLTGGSVSGGCHRLHLFPGFYVGGARLPAAVDSRRVSVLRLAYRELMAIAPRRPFFAGSSSSWRQTVVAVPPALPPSI